MTPEQVLKVQHLYGLKQQLDALKDQEMALRKELVAELFPDLKELQEGTFKQDVTDKVKLKLVTSNNRTLEADGLNAMLDALEQDESEKGAQAKLLSDLVVPYKPTLNLSQFKKAPDWFQKALQPFIVVKPGAPQVSFEFAEAQQLPVEDSGT